MKIVDLELIQSAFAQPRLVVDHKNRANTQISFSTVNKHVYFADLPSSSTNKTPDFNPITTTTRGGAPVNVNNNNNGTENDVTDDIDSILGDFKTNMEFLEDSTIKLPDSDLLDNIDSYNKVRRIIFGQAIKYNITKIEQKYIVFSDIVDVDENGIERHINEGLAARLGEGQLFRIFILLTILFNAIVIGLGTDNNLLELANSIFVTLENVFLTIYIIEILLKWYYGFSDFWQSSWNIFDFTIVLTGLIPNITLSISRTIRLFRVLRTLRMLRNFSMFQGLDLVVETIIASFTDMLSIVLLILVTMFIWALAGTTLFALYDDANFGDLGKTMFTLFVIISEDGWYYSYQKLVEKGLFIQSSLYFGSFLTIGSFVLKQVIVAIVVTDLQESQEIVVKSKSLAKKQLKTDVQSTRGQKRFQKETVPPPHCDSSIWKQQIPFEIPNFETISVAKLERYFTVLAIIEENIEEYASLKKKLDDILKEIKELNAVASDGEDSEDYENEENEEFYNDEGDAISQWIRQKQESKTKKS